MYFSALAVGRVVFKDLIYDSIMYAARTEQLGAALNAVSASNNVSRGTLSVLERQIKSIGVTTQDARNALLRLTAAQIDVTKATQLSKVALDVARVSGVSGSEAMEQLTHAIVTQQPRVLHTMGLMVNLNHEYARFAQQNKRTVESLTEHERRQILLNAVLRLGANYAKVYDESMTTAGGRMLSLRRGVLDTADAFGSAFLPALKDVIFALDKFFKMTSQYGQYYGETVKTALGFTVNPLWTLKGYAQDAYSRVRGLNNPASLSNNDIASVARSKMAEAVNHLIS